MAVQFAGNGGAVAEVDGTLFRALRITPRPIDVAGLGHYRLSRTVNLLAAQAANGNLFSWRWGDATRFAVLTKMRLTVLQTAAATATIMPSFQAFIARSFTVSDSIGTAITLGGNAFKKRANMGASLVTDVRYSTTTAGLTSGTRTLDTEAFLELPTQQTITTPNAVMWEKELDVGMGDGNYPYTFAQNEGFVIKGPTVVFGAAGTANLIVDISWAEVAAFG